MEVASPLTFSHAAAGTKRSLGVCSPSAHTHSLKDSTNRSHTGMDMSMTDDPSSMQRAFKRRRFQPDTAMDDNNNGGITTDNSHYHPFVNMSLSKNIFGGTNINNGKRNWIVLVVGVRLLRLQPLWPFLRWPRFVAGLLCYGWLEKKLLILNLTPALVFLLSMTCFITL